MAYERLSLAVLVSAIAAVLLAAPTLVAQERSKSRSADGDGFWTDQRMLEARPEPLPEPSIQDSRALRSLEASGPVRVQPDRPPKRREGDGIAAHLYRPDEDLRATDEGPLLHKPQAVTTDGAGFTQSRVFPNRTTRAHPYRTIGKLFVHDPLLDLSFVCSAAVIQRRLVLTAGHCVYSFDGIRPHFREQIRFVPAHDRGRAPFGTWEWSWVRVSDSWFDGGGFTPNAADFAIVEIEDRVIRGRRKAIGDVTGWLGSATSADIDHITQLGYPFNLDAGERMQVTNGVLAGLLFPNAFEFGSDQQGGASGGPIVRDFGVRARGQPGESRNQVVSVVSFGTDSRRVLGGSILNGEFIDLFDRACAQSRGNCE